MTSKNLVVSILLLSFAGQVQAIVNWLPYNIQNMLWITEKKLLKAAVEGKGERADQLIVRGAGVRLLMLFAARDGHEKAISILADRGANVNEMDGWDATPMHYAASNGHQGVICELAKRGADLDAKDYNGDTPMDVAKSQEIRDILKKIHEDRQKAASELQKQISQNGN